MNIEHRTDVGGKATAAMLSLLITLALFLVLPYLDLLSSRSRDTRIIRDIDAARMLTPPPAQRPELTRIPEPQKARKLPRPRLQQQRLQRLPVSANWNLAVTLGNVGGDFDLGFAIRPDELATSPGEMIFDIADLDQAPQPIVRLHPMYPLQARLRGEEGSVVVEFVVSEDGTTRDVRVLQSEPGEVFVPAARRAIEKWKFKPGMKDGQPVPVRVRQKVSFRLEG